MVSVSFVESIKGFVKKKFYSFFFLFLFVFVFLRNWCEQKLPLFKHSLTASNIFSFFLSLFFLALMVVVGVYDSLLGFFAKVRRSLFRKVRRTSSKALKFALAIKD